MKLWILSRILTCGILTCGMSAVAADEYNLDTDHTTVMFKVSHLGFSNTYGRFNKVSGGFSIDEKNASKSKMQIEIDAASIDSGNAKRDDHLRGADFLNAKQNPKITFKSDSVKKLSDKDYEIAGKLSLNGVTKTQKVTFTRFGTGEDPFGNFRTGGETKFTIKRSDFKVKYMLPKIPDEVEMTVSLEGIKKK